MGNRSETESHGTTAFDGTRRTLLAGGGALALTTLLASCGKGDDKVAQKAAATGGPLNVLVYGGPVEEVYKTQVGAYLKSSGYDVTVSTSASNASTILAQLPQPKYDLFVDGSNVVPRYPAVYSAIPIEKIPNYSLVAESLLQGIAGKAVPTYMQSMAVVYNSKKFSQPPTLQDLLTPRFQGRWTMQGTPWLSLFAPLIMQYVGGTAEDPQPIFAWFERAVKTMKTAYTQVTQPAQMFASDEIDVALWFTGRAAQVAATSQVPIAWARKPAVANIQAFGIPPGASNQAGALAFINRWLDPAVQRAASEATYFAPILKAPGFPEELAAKLPVYGEADLNALTYPDWATISPKLPEWEKQMVAILQSKK